MLKALLIQRIFSIPTDTLLIVFLKFSQELRDFCGFDVVPDHPADHVGAEDEAPAQAALGDGLRPYADLTTSFMRNQLILKGVAVYENIQEQAVRCGADALRKCSDIPGAGRHGAGIYRDDCSSAVLCKRKLDLLKGTARTRAFPFIFALISQLLLRRTMLVKGGKGAWTK